MSKLLGPKTCTKCNTLKPVEDYGIDGKSCWCKTCTSGYNKKYYEENRERIKAYVRAVNKGEPAFMQDRTERIALRCNPVLQKDRKRKQTRTYQLKKHGWTVEEFNTALEEHNGYCANPCCLNRATDADHNHKTGKRRDVLCNACNTSLGKLGEDPLKIAGLLEYLEAWN